jgi:hypothetical protein
MAVSKQSNGRGSLVLDRIFPGVGRVRVASGTTKRRVAEALDTMLGTLYELGRADLLGDIRDRRLHPMEVYPLFRSGNVQDIPTGEFMVLVKDDVYGWIDEHECSDGHRVDLRGHIKRLLALAGEETPVGDLPYALELYRKEMKDRPAAFNRTRAAVLAYLRHKVGRHHRLWGQAADVQLRKERKARGHPVTPEQLAKITGKMKQPYAAMAWTMALTGMGRREYWGEWEVLEDRVAIHGTKREGRERVVPLVGTLVPPGSTYKPFLEALKAAGDIRLYDLRRSYANWLEAAMVPRTRRKQYLGHSTDVTGRYEWHEVEVYLQDDAEALLRHLGGVQRQMAAVG